MISFVTGSERKFEEVKALLSVPITRVEIDLPEIQSLDPREVMEHKARAAEAHAKGEYIIEDTSLFLDCLDGTLPGPLIKWFLQSIGAKGIAELVEKMGINGAEGVTLFAHAAEDGAVTYFEGRVRGTIVPPRGDKDYGWGPIFVPDGATKTFGEMERPEKALISMRGIAARKLDMYLMKIKT